jgi:hypothetical protein
MPLVGGPWYGERYEESSTPSHRIASAFRPVRPSPLGSGWRPCGLQGFGWDHVLRRLGQSIDGLRHLFMARRNLWWWV